jgi:hypothetical protein
MFVVNSFHLLRKCSFPYEFEEASEDKIILRTQRSSIQAGYFHGEFEVLTIVSMKSTIFLEMVSVPLKRR